MEIMEDSDSSDAEPSNYVTIFNNAEPSNNYVTIFKLDKVQPIRYNLDLFYKG